ncbi:MAG: lipopolysaccharide heptosyltransferase II [Phycisphaerae bacterium]|nr:lipopolysaccharide heptosyltransferase II [Phycisphaerae bacterium]
MKPKRLLIWLPSPLGDAIMATPALRAFRSIYKETRITFLAPEFTQQILCPSPFCDDWIVLPKSFWAIVKMLKSQSFDESILLKNSFGSALTVRLAGIGRRIGYARDGRSFLLTDKIEPLRTEKGDYKPAPMTDYYLKIADYLGGAIDHRKPELTVTDECVKTVQEKLPPVKNVKGPLVILVPGGAFGPSKLWPIERWATLADKLYETYQAMILLSVAPINEEIEIAEHICKQATSNPIHLGDTPLFGGELKALFSLADLVITNDTGPRHIAIALDKNVVSLFGPNNPQWTQVEHEKEIQIIGKAPCVPCNKPQCRQNEHLCMESITVEEVLESAGLFLGAQ